MTDKKMTSEVVHMKASLYAYHRIMDNDYYFTFEAKAYPEEEEFGHLGFIKPYFAEVNPQRPLGRPLDHTENPATRLPIPRLLKANCLDVDQYPWNILCSGSDGLSLDWDSQRYAFHLELNVAAYKAQPASLTIGQERSVLLRAMSTVTGTALQTSYP